MKAEVVLVETSLLRHFRHRGREYVATDLERIPEVPLVSCLCVTENRHAFVPWMLWGYDRQKWTNRELVIVDSSDPPIEVPRRDDVRIVRTDPGTPLGKKRNIALEAARGEIIAWFDDDDWQHPMRLAWLVPELRESAETHGISFLGPSRSWFLSIDGRHSEHYDVGRYAIFNGAVFYTEMARRARFPEDVLRTEDTLWVSALLRFCRGGAWAGEQPLVFFWLTHETNTTNRRGARAMSGEPSSVRRAVGKYWGDTTEQLRALRARLAAWPSALPRRVREAEGDEVQGSAATLSPGKSRRLCLYRLVPNRLLTAADSRFLAQRTGGRSNDDEVFHVATQRRGEWIACRYVGFVHQAGLDAGLVDFDLFEEQLDRSPDAGALGAGPTESAAPWEALFAAHSVAKLVARRVLVEELGFPEELLTRRVPIVARWAWAMRRDVFECYAQKVLSPLHAVLANRQNRSLRDLLTAATLKTVRLPEPWHAQPSGSVRTATSRARSVVEAILEGLPSVFLARQGVDVLTFAARPTERGARHG